MLTRPECCVSEGMDCRICMRNTALNVARVCGEMDQAALRSVFLNLYSHPFCRAKMHLFQQAFPHPEAPTPATAAA